MKKHYYLEVTDLFCGELNYSFVQRFTVESVSIRGAIAKLSRHIGLNFRCYFNGGYDAIYHSTSKLTGVYIEEYDTNDADSWAARNYCEGI